MKYLIVLLLICKIFSYWEGDKVGKADTETDITEWLKGKKVVSVAQSSASMGTISNNSIISGMTSITIIAEGGKV